ALGRPGGLGDGVAEAHHEIGVGHAPAGRERHQRQEVAVIPLDARECIQPARADAGPLDGRGDAAGPVQEREELGIWPVPAERFEALLPAAHARQPVVNQHHPFARPRVHATLHTINGPRSLADSSRAGEERKIGLGCGNGLRRRAAPVPFREGGYAATQDRGEAAKTATLGWRPRPGWRSHPPLPHPPQGCRGPTLTCHRPGSYPSITLALRFWPQVCDLPAARRNNRQRYTRPPANRKRLSSRCRTQPPRAVCTYSTLTGLSFRCS